MTESPTTTTTYTLYTIFDTYTEEWCAAIHRARDGHHVQNVRGDTSAECLREAARVIDELVAADRDAHDRAMTQLALADRADRERQRELAVPADVLLRLIEATTRDELALIFENDLETLHVARTWAETWCSRDVRYSAHPVAPSCPNCGDTSDHPCADCATYGAHGGECRHAATV